MSPRSAKEVLAPHLFPDSWGVQSVYETQAIEAMEEYAGEIAADTLTVIEKARARWCAQNAATIEECTGSESLKCVACAMVREIRDALRS